MTKIWLNKRDEEEEEEAAKAKIERGMRAMKSKTLYICSFEQNQTVDKSRNWGAYAVRAADLSDLNTKLELRQVGYRAGEELPANGGCGVLGSRIIFASGLKPYAPWAYGPEASTRAYVLDTNDPKHEIVDMDESLHEGKNFPLTMEVGGKLYVLSTKWYGLELNSFEVFDPVRRKWSLLPEFPNCGHELSCAVADTKLFVSHEKSLTVCCLDLANPTHWRHVPSMCGGGPFPFSGKALVLDTEHHDKKIVFGGARGGRVLVYLMSLNEETVTLIHELKLPAYQLPPGEPSQYDFLPLAHGHVCLVIPEFIVPYKDLPEHHYDLGTHLLHAAVMPFRFQFDISKGFHLQSHPPHILEYRTNPSTLPFTSTLGCFLL